MNYSESASAGDSGSSDFIPVPIGPWRLSHIILTKQEVFKILNSNKSKNLQLIKSSNIYLKFNQYFLSYQSIVSKILYIIYQAQNSVLQYIKCYLPMFLLQISSLSCRNFSKFTVLYVIILHGPENKLYQ